MACAVVGCNKEGSLRKGLCSMHWGRLRRDGDVGGVEPIKTRNTIIPWLEAHVEYQGDDCLSWPFHKSHKYGLVSTQATGQIQANRFMCMLAHGEPPTPTHQAAHSCGNGHKGCLNPRHLSWKTPKGNAADRNMHGTALIGQKNPAAKLSELEVVEIIRRLAQGEPGRDVANLFGVSASLVSMIRKGQKWSYLPRPTNLSIHGNAGLAKHIEGG